MKDGVRFTKVSKVIFPHLLSLSSPDLSLRSTLHKHKINKLILAEDKVG